VDLLRTRRLPRGDQVPGRTLWVPFSLVKSYLLGHLVSRTVPASENVPPRLEEQVSSLEKTPFFPTSALSVDAHTTASTYLIFCLQSSYEPREVSRLHLFRIRRP